MPQPKLIWLMSHIDGNPLQPPAEISPSSQEWVWRTDVYFLILLTNVSGRVSPVTLHFMLTLSPQSSLVVGWCLLDLFQWRWIVVVVVVVSANGKIQGDGRKFLDRFKSYSGSQISSQSLNEVHIYRLQPQSATKGDFFHIFLSLIISSRCHGLQMANEADEVLLGKRPR